MDSPFLSQKELELRIFRGNNSNYQSKNVAKALDIANNVIIPRYISLTSKITIIDEIPKKKILFEDTSLTLYSNSLAVFFKEAKSVVLFCATLGHGLDREIKLAQTTDLELSYLLDECGFCVIEKLCNEISKAISDKYESKVTLRYSIGYGDTDLSRQADFLKVLQAEKKLGIYLTEGGMMLPTKTVTAMIGVKNEI